MTPTPRLRWIHRKIPNVTSRVEMVLQQWYAYDINYPTEKGEWKDVPLEKEDAR